MVAISGPHIALSLEEGVTSLVNRRLNKTQKRSEGGDRQNVALRVG